MSSAKKLLEAAAGTAAAGGGSLDLSEVFSTHLYKGTGSAQTVNNGLDLSGEGGMIWIKSRSNSANHVIVDTEQGAYGSLAPNTNDKKRNANTVTAFSSSGFTVANDTSDSVFQNTTGVSGQSYASWTFRKAPKFFDIVTYTGNGAQGRNIAHELGTTVGSMMIKRTSAAYDWVVYHKSLGPTKALFLNKTDVAETNVQWFNNTAPTSEVFTVGASGGGALNFNGQTYVAYLYAHNNGDGDFGSGGDQDIISCGVTGTSNGINTVNLGWEPQFVITKFAVAQTGATSNNWYIFDNMRTWADAGINASAIMPSANSAEFTAYIDAINITSRGFTFNPGRFNGPSTYVYIAIRAPMITTPAAATEVFAIDTFGGAGGGVAPAWRSGNPGFAVDMAYYKDTGTDSNTLFSRLRTTKSLITNTTAPEGSRAAGDFAFNNGYYNYSSSDSNLYSWMWKRAKGYMDVVCYAGTASYPRTPSHSLGVVPEMMWVKLKNATAAWSVYHSGIGNTKRLVLNTNAATVTDSGDWNDTTPTNSVFTLGNNETVNTNGGNYIAYLFATLAGISKVGSVAHSGSSTNVDCGFSNGAKFILLKRTDATGDWYYWDSTRGIVAGNDPYLLINSTAAQVTNTDYIDPLSSGFTITGDFTDGTYIFYAVA